jgi:hypothetical protein
MSLETQIKNLELRLQMAITHVVQAQADLDVVRGKAGLPAARPLFRLTTAQAQGQAEPPDEEEARANRVAAIRGIAELAARRRAEAAEPPAPKLATAEEIHRAAALAKGEIVELPAAGSTARAILESAAKRRSETLDGKPL